MDKKQSKTEQWIIRFIIDWSQTKPWRFPLSSRLRNSHPGPRMLGVMQSIKISWGNMEGITAHTSSCLIWHLQRHFSTIWKSLHPIYKNSKTFFLTSQHSKSSFTFLPPWLLLPPVTSSLLTLFLHSMITLPFLFLSQKISFLQKRSCRWSYPEIPLPAC